MKERGLNGNTLKLMAVVAMIIDHIGWAFLPEDSLWGIIFHTIGKTTGPLMCFFIAEGNHYTKSLNKYIFRLSVFTVISQIPFSLFINQGKLLLFPLNMGFTLLCGLLALVVYKQVKQPFAKYVLMAGTVVVTAFSDWAIYGVLFIIVFGVFYEDKKMQFSLFLVLGLAKAISYSISDKGILLYRFIPMVVSIGIVLALLSFYNGKKGRGKYAKWLFYVVYPLQFLVIGGIALMVR